MSGDRGKPTVLNKSSIAETLSGFGSLASHEEIHNYMWFFFFKQFPLFDFLFLWLFVPLEGVLVMFLLN